MPSKRKTKARGRPQLDSGDDTDHGSGQCHWEDNGEGCGFREEEELNGLKNTLSSTSSRASCP